MNAAMRPRILTRYRRCRYVFGARRYELVMTTRGYQITVDPPRPRLLRWCDWRYLPHTDAISAENMFWRVVAAAAMARRPHVRWAVIGDAHMAIVRDEHLNYHVVVSRCDRPRARTCGKSWRDALQTGAEVAGELLCEQPRRPGIGDLRW